MFAMHRWLLVPFVAAWLVTDGAAQRTWVVDDAGGMGSDFKELQPAFNAAKPGDTILVRKGSYTPATTNKGVQLLGVDGVRFKTLLFPPQNECLIVRGLPAGQTFVMKGFGINDNPVGRTVLLFEQNKGRVHLESLRVDSFGLFIQAQFTRPVLFVRDCEQVSVAGCHFAGRPGFVSERSIVAATACDFVGGDAGQHAEIVWPSQPGLRGVSSRLTLARSSSKGGAGAQTYRGVRPASPAAAFDRCDVELSGDAGSIFEAGNLSNSELGMHALETAGGGLLLDPTVRLIPKGNAPTIRGTAPVVGMRLPSLTATGAPPNGTISTDLYAPAGSVQVMLLGLPGSRVRHLFGDVWLDPATTTIVDASRMDASEHRVTRFSVPNDTRLRGIAVAFQALNAVTAIRASNPVIVVLY